MDNRLRRVATTPELMAAVADGSVDRIVVVSSLAGVPTLRLSPGQRLVGGGAGIALRFASGQDGVQLSCDNTVEDVELISDPARCALLNDTGLISLGLLALRRLRVTGAVRLLARDAVRSGHVEAHDVDVVAADARGWDERPSGYGVQVVPGAFTLWNQQAEAEIRITADLTGLAAGRAGAPVRGSGIFVGGNGGGGMLVVRRLETGEVHSDGGIAPGTADRISGGVFTVSGAVVDSVRNRGPVTTYGPNDMVLDNWGVVDHWLAEGKVTSFGPSGIGFVNFGVLNLLQVTAPIETLGRGARGFNVYSGTVGSAEFERVVTRADGAVGIQISQPVGRIAVRRGIETFGGIGDSLVKGVVTKLPATALSVKPGGSAREIVINGGLLTHGAGIEPLELHGSVTSLTISGGLGPAGGGFETL